MSDTVRALSCISTEGNTGPEELQSDLSESHREESSHSQDHHDFETSHSRHRGQLGHRPRHELRPRGGVGRPPRHHGLPERGQGRGRTAAAPGAQARRHAEPAAAGHYVGRVHRAGGRGHRVVARAPRLARQQRGRHGARRAVAPRRAARHVQHQRRWRRARDGGAAPAAAALRVARRRARRQRLVDARLRRGPLRRRRRPRPRAVAGISHVQGGAQHGDGVPARGARPSRRGGAGVRQGLQGRPLLGLLPGLRRDQPHRRGGPPAPRRHGRRERRDERAGGARDPAGPAGRRDESLCPAAGGAYGVVAAGRASGDALICHIFGVDCAGRAFQCASPSSVPFFPTRES